MIGKLFTPVVAGLLTGKAISWYWNKQADAKRTKLRKDKKVDVAAEDSFPASDPPSWNYVHKVGAPKQSA